MQSYIRDEVKRGYFLELDKAQAFRAYAIASLVQKWSMQLVSPWVNQYIRIPWEKVCSHSKDGPFAASFSVMQ
jgi:hypothetical protein